MSASVQTPAGLKTASAVYIQTAAGLKTASAGYVGTAAGAKQFFSSGGGGGGGTTPPPVTPPFNVAISQSGSGLGSITAGQNASETLSAVVSQGSAALAPPFTYAWTASSSNTSVARVSLSSTAVQSPTLSESGVSAGTATITVGVVVTDANGVQETATLSYTVNVAAASGGGSGGATPRFSVAIANSNASGDMGNIPTGVTRTETLTAEYAAGSSALDPPFSNVWSVTVNGNGVTASLSSNSGGSVVLSLTGATVGNATTYAVHCTSTDASGASVAAPAFTGGVNTGAS